MNQREDGIGTYQWGPRRGSLFEDRVDAGARLSDALAQYRGQDALVLGLPRGGVPVASEVARALDADLDVVVARKLGAPFQPELALGAIAADGTRYLNEDLVREVGVSEQELDAIADVQSREAQRREQRFRGGLAPLDPQGRVVIIVDDGLATGATMRAAVRSLGQQSPKKLVVAVPVGALETCTNIGRDVDDIVCLHTPDPFYAVGLHYRDFEQTSDEEVDQILREHRELRARRRGEQAHEAPHGPAA